MSVERPEGLLAAPIHNSYASYGCRVNALDPEEVFRRYEQTGFIYPAKMARLRPFLPVITEQWRKALRAGELILRVITYDLRPSADFATVSSWLTTSGGRMNQHLASTGQPLASRASLLSTTAVCIHDGVERSHQIWFRADNKYARRLFGGIGKSLGAHVASVNTWEYLGVPLSICSQSVSNLVAVESSISDVAMLCDLGAAVRGPVYAIAEELDSEDLKLQVVDDLYRRVGLRRYRRIVLVKDPKKDSLLAAAVVYRGPIGMNFSFLENRCDLLVSNDIPDEQLPDVVGALLPMVGAEYEDFLPGLVPITTDQRTSKLLLLLGGHTLARYSSSVWLQEGLAPFYRHVEKVYERITSLKPNHRDDSRGVTR